MPCRTLFHCRVCNCIRSCSWNLFLQCRINTWKNHRSCPLNAKGLFTRCFLSLLTPYLCFNIVFLPLNSLPPTMLCFQTRSRVCQLIGNRISRVTSVSPYPSYVKVQLFSVVFPHVTEQCCQRSVFPRHKFLIDERLDVQRIHCYHHIAEGRKLFSSTQLFSQKSASIRAYISAVVRMTPT